jgi:hypothetical protein
MERYELHYRDKRKAENGNLPLIHAFLGKTIRVKISEGLEAQGVLLRYQLQGKGEHKPNLLVLKNGSGIQIVRGNWLAISEVEKA